MRGPSLKGPGAIAQHPGTLKYKYDTGGTPTMSQAEEQIVCRQCREVIPFQSGGCPHCGTSERDRWKWIAVVAVGVIISIFSLVATIWSFLAVGAFLVVIGGYILWDQRNRRQQAEQRIQQAARSGQREDEGEGVEAEPGTP